MRQKKIFILIGHPDKDDTLSRLLADTYEEAARKAGHEVKKMHLAEMQFDPILHKGYKVIQELEPDLKTFDDNLKWCEHFLLIYPNWWCTMPALLKGLFDRAWLPGICFHMHKHKDGTPAMGWDRMMKGRTARVVVLSGTRPILIRIMFGDYTNEIKRGVLWFAGFKTRVTRLGPSEHIPERRLKRWQKKMAGMGKWGC